MCVQYDRVHSVMNRYCVGWSHHCNDYHKLPGSQLPVVWTKPSSIHDDGEVLIRARDMGTSSSVKVLSHGKEASATYYEFRHSGDFVSKYFYFSRTGYYRFEGVFKGSPSCCDSLYIKVSYADGKYPGSYQLWDLNIPSVYSGKWQWYMNSPRIYVNAGFRTLMLKYREHIYFDALLVKYDGKT